MKTYGVWLEVTISGFVFLLSGILLIMSALNKYELSDLDLCSKNFVVMTPLMIAASYVIGAIVHRLIPRFWFHVRRLFSQLRGKEASDKSNLRNDRYHGLTVLWQYGSERIQRELDFQYSLFALFRSLTHGFPLLGLSYFLWAREANLRADSVWIGTAVCSLLTVATFAAYLGQRRNNIDLRNAIFREMVTVKK